jgi:6-phosphogluconolactonase (cycloisomerase 2 family)
MTFTSTRRQVFAMLTLAVAAIAAMTASTLALAERDTLRHGKIFTSTNSPAGNELLVYAQSESGPATFVTRAATNGVGSGGGLGSQGAVTLSRNGAYLFVVNAASNTVSTFAFSGAGVILTSVVDSGGLMPTSVTERAGLVYVLNAGGSGNVAGFRNVKGVLAPVSDGSRPLSAGRGTPPAQASFSTEGDVLVVTERNTNRLTSYAVLPNGTLGTRVVTQSGGITPFGFAFTRRNQIVVSEAAGGATDASTVSSYRFDDRAPVAPVLVSRAVPTTQTAACWIAVTPDGKFAYAANAGSSSISSFSIARNGAITLLQGAAGLTGPNAGALDMAVTPDGQQLHAFAPRGLQIVSFTIGGDGSLTPLGGVGGLPTGTAGLAAN